MNIKVIYIYITFHVEFQYILTPIHPYLTSIGKDRAPPVTCFPGEPGPAGGLLSQRPVPSPGAERGGPGPVLGLAGGRRPCPPPCRCTAGVA